MQNFIISLFLISFSISETYSWEDGEGTILGTYFTIDSYENIESTDTVDPYDGDRMLKVVNGASGETERVYLAWITDISEGDQITASYYAYDINSVDEYPKQRIWAHWTNNDDINSYAGSASGPDDYSDGPGWSKLEHTWSTADGWSEGSALCIEARFYSSESEENLIDLIEVTTTSTTATINLPGPVTELTADAGNDQTVDAGSMVTLDGSNSANPNGDIAAYFWEQTSGIAVNLDDEEAMTTTFTAPNESTNLVFDLTVYDADGNESSDSITINVIASVGNLTISEIQGEQDSSPYVDQYVTTSGYVMAKNSNGFFIQDAEAAWSGIWVVDFGNANTSVGDNIEVSGQVKEYYNLTEIDISDGSSNILSSNNVLFNPLVIAEVSEAYESVLVTVAGVCDGLPNQYGEWTLSGITIDDYLYGSDWGDFVPVLGNEYTITGPLNYAYSIFRVNPRSDDDIQSGILSNSEFIQDFSIIEAYPNPFNPEINIKFSTNSSQFIEVSIYDLMGQKIDILYNGFVLKNTINSIVWNANDFSSGEYFIQVKSDNDLETKKITLLK
tara:strand:- start:141 stop:1817 length:1677 start_codon:yes stop_codon:yes gene_type:complete